jgi:hypothetical protein
MKKYIVFNNKGEPEQTEFEYRLGEVITVNSITPMKCMEKKIVEGKLIHYFKEGKLTVTY